MLTKTWFTFSEETLKEASERAVHQVSEYSDRQRRGRDENTLHENACRGNISEMHHNNGDIEWWRAHNDQANVDHDDGGFDDRQGRNVKAILDWHQRVYVGDARAETYVVYEVDETNKRIRYRGQFNRSDIHELPGGDRGVFVWELK